MRKEITLTNIKSFLEGYKNMFLLQLGSKPDYFKEQVAYRMSVCANDCMIKKQCKYCGCAVPAKMMVEKSCNGGQRFPDIMNEEQWNQFKIDNKII